MFQQQVKAFVALFARTAPFGTATHRDSNVDGEKHETNPETLVVASYMR